MVDEAGKLGTKPLLELLKQASRCRAQLILAGDSAQLPPVERGLGFKTFSERYRAHHLENIQRQKEESQREIAHKLAKGEMGRALDAIVREGRLHWTASKEEALETLIKAWATNRTSNPNETTLILAHSNREVRALNELARLYRKEAGELKEKEYQCETAYGKVYLSEGDLIAFRKKDKELGVNNGSEGVLVKASLDGFVVQLQEGREVTFDPRDYQSFQLGYATTYYRSQGRAADKVFVLHSPMMNKEMFYVGLTRHFKRVECFISSQEAKNLADLKRQVYRQTSKASTLEYLTPNDLEKSQSQKEKHDHIEALKSSHSLLDQAKGIGLSAWEEIRLHSFKILEKYKDKKPARAFFNPKLDNTTLPGKVQEVKFEEEIKLAIPINFKEISQQTEQPTPPKPKTNTPWKKLSEEKRDLLKEYFKRCDQASSLYTIVKAEEEVGKSHYQEWQKACIARNAQAYEVTKALNTHQLRSLFEPKSLTILQERAAKHAIQLHQKENTLSNLDASLKENLEPLLLKLFPAGPTQRTSKGLRFGAKGSLAITFTGAKAGSFYDFEEQQGGGPLQLIQKSLSCTFAEAITWARDFLVKAPTLQIPSQFTFKNSEKNQEWVSLKPNTSAPTLSEISKKLTTEYKETARYAYRDSDGQILFYTLRLEDKTGKKIVLPLSYGYYLGNSQEPSWSLKGYQSNKKPLYNLHFLKAFPNTKVLLVEGEKTAEAATKLFPKEKMICLTWSGGAGAVHKTDWHPLSMREVIIWPDNDKAGFEASNTICRELRKVGTKSLHEVDKSILVKELPPKWDLADPLPPGKESTFIKEMILRAQEKAVGLASLLTHLKAHSVHVDVQTAHQALSHIEEKIRPTLEQNQKSWEIKSTILDQTLSKLKHHSKQITPQKATSKENELER